MRGDRAGGPLRGVALRPARKLQRFGPEAGGIGIQPQDDLRSSALDATGELVAEADALAVADVRPGRGRRGRRLIRLRCVGHVLRYERAGTGTTS